MPGRRQLADDIFWPIGPRLFGRLPKRTGWQPVLPNQRSREREIGIDLRGHRGSKTELDM
jgi:hypothetical protein